MTALTLFISQIMQIMNSGKEAKKISDVDNKMTVKQLDFCHLSQPPDCTSDSGCSCSAGGKGVEQPLITDTLDKSC